MTIETALRLKADLTDKHVVVKADVPELARFAKLTGLVKTVNMNGRALVQFDGPEDISWYDIAPEYLTVVPAPVKMKAAEKNVAPATTGTASEKRSPVAGTPAAKSPLEQARAQAAAASGQPAPAEKKLSPLELARKQVAGGTTAKPAAPAPAATPAAAPAKKLSPLELARQQGAGGKAPAAPAATPAAPSPAPSAAKKSPLEIARAQDAGEGECLSAPSAEAPAAPAPAPAAPAPAPAGGKKLSPIELARQQGAFKG